MYQNMNSAVGIFGSSWDAEIAVMVLQKSGFDKKKLSLLGGLLVGWMMSAFALAEPLASIGIPKASIHQYQNALKTNKFIIIVQGSLPEVEKAANILINNKAEYANYHKIMIEKP